MSRINVEDDVFRDPRWFGLLSVVGDPDAALGKLVLFWFLGQKFWINGEQLIPNGMIPASLKPVISAGFGEEREGGVYVRGSREKFAWLQKKRDAGRIGGKISSQRPRNDLGHLTPITSQAEPSTCLGVSQAKPKHTQPSYSSSSSYSYSKRKKLLVPTAGKIQLSAEGDWSPEVSDRIQKWKDSFPGIDVEAELKKAAVWARANPKNKKSNWERFLVNWLNRTQDRARPNRTGSLDLVAWAREEDRKAGRK